MAFRTLQSLFQALPKTPRVTTVSPGPRFLCKFGTAPDKPSIQTLAKVVSSVKHTAPKPLLAFCGIQQPLRIQNILNPFFSQSWRNFHLLTPQIGDKSILQSNLGIHLSNQTRSVTKFSLKKGTRKTVKAVVCRFYRLDWGIWIHPKSGRHNKLWKKGKLRRKRLRQHVFTNAWQTRTLERMTTKYWHKKKYWVDDPYENYHKRDNFPITKNTRNIVDQLI